jgi:hypothetical protein
MHLDLDLRVCVPGMSHSLRVQGARKY